MHTFHRSRLAAPLLAAALALCAAGAQAKGSGGHGGHGSGGGHGGGHSAVSGGRHGAADSARAIHTPGTVTAGSSGSRCGSRDERGNCMAPRLRPPDFGGGGFTGGFGTP